MVLLVGQMNLFQGDLLVRWLAFLRDELAVRGPAWHGLLDAGAAAGNSLSGRRFWPAWSTCWRPAASACLPVALASGC